jgi:pyruvate dehydrogenase E2 component (dihydrolipoamide acetyltransferase)
MFRRTVDPSSAGTEPTGLKGAIRILEPDRAQRSIARRTAETRATVPDLELSREVEIEAALELADRRGSSVTAVLVRACALALPAHPLANAAYRDGHYELYSRINIGVAIHTDGGYITPTVLDADAKSLEECSEELQALSEKARAGALAPPELAGTTFTVTDHSDHRIDRWSALVTPPHAATLTAGAIRSAPVVRQDAVVPGRIIGLTLACDHRILFGARAAAFLDAVADRLERAQL